MTGISVRHSAAAISDDGLRQVDLRQDLRPLSDLIEHVFADSMDSSGRSAIREMRYLSHMGYGLNLVARLNELTLGISLGFVYQVDGALVGNVSIYPAGYPKDMDEAWILANVCVLPAHQRRGIAGELVDSSLRMIQARGGKQVILQVDSDNEAALKLYESRGFSYERAWGSWRRSGFIGAPFAGERKHHITRARHDEWPALYALAAASRPNCRGGLGWLKPLHISDFRAPWRQRLLNFLTLNSLEKLVIRNDAGDAILASCWLESSVGGGALRLRLFTAPGTDEQSTADALLGNVLARHPRSTIIIEHPRDDSAVIDLLKRFHFKRQRELWHMRLDL